MLLGDIREGFPEEVMFDEGKACTQDKVGEGNLGKGLSCANVRLTHLGTSGSSEKPQSLWGSGMRAGTVGRASCGGALGMHWCLYPFGDPHLCLSEYTLTAVRKPDCED